MNDVFVIISSFLLGGFFLILTLQGVFAYTFDQQFEVCEVLNLSFSECADFWESIETLPCEVCNTSSNVSCICSNGTIILNHTNTIYEYKYLSCNQSDCDSYCDNTLEFLRESHSYNLELARIEKGIISNVTCIIPSNLISNAECSLRISKALTDNILPRNYDDEDALAERVPAFFYFIVLFLIVAVVGFIIWQFKKQLPSGTSPSGYSNPLDIPGFSPGMSPYSPEIIPKCRAPPKPLAPKKPSEVPPNERHNPDQESLFK